EFSSSSAHSEPPGLGRLASAGWFRPKDSSTLNEPAPCAMHAAGQVCVGLVRSTLGVAGKKHLYGRVIDAGKDGMLVSLVDPSWRAGPCSKRAGERKWHLQARRRSECAESAGRNAAKAS